MGISQPNMAIHLAQGWTKGTFSFTRFEVAWNIWQWYFPIYLCDAHIATSQKSHSLRFRYSTSRLLTASPVQASSLQDLRSAHFDWTETYRRQDFSDPPLAWCSRWIKPTWPGSCGFSPLRRGTRESDHHLESRAYNVWGLWKGELDVVIPYTAPISFTRFHRNYLLPKPTGRPMSHFMSNCLFPARTQKKKFHPISLHFG